MQTTEQPRISLEQSRESLAPLEQTLRGCIMDASELYQKMCLATPELAVALSSSGRARCNLLYALIAENVRTRVPACKDVDVAVEEKSGLVEVVLDAGKFILRLRFKKVDHKLRSRNYPTKQQQSICQQLSLFGEPQETVRLIIGHQWDPTGMYVADAHVIYPFGSNPLWSYQLDSGSEGLGVPPLVVPTAPVPATSVRSKLVKEQQVANAAEA
jgi:hypothetical protein